MFGNYYLFSPITGEPVAVLTETTEGQWPLSSPSRSRERIRPMHQERHSDDASNSPTSDSAASINQRLSSHWKQETKLWLALFGCGFLSILFAYLYAICQAGFYLSPESAFHPRFNFLFFATSIGLMIAMTAIWIVMLCTRPSVVLGLFLFFGFPTFADINAVIFSMGDSIPHQTTALTNGDKIIQAILKFEAQFGRVPQTLAELVPDFLSEIPTTGVPRFPTFTYNYQLEQPIPADWSLSWPVTLPNGDDVVLVHYQGIVPSERRLEWTSPAKNYWIVVLT